MKKKNIVSSPQEKFADIAKEKEDARIAALNLLEDLSVEKSKVEMARAKEEAILLSIGDGLIATDENGIILLINQMAEMLLLKKSAEVVGEVFFDAIAMEDEKGVTVPVEKRPMSMALATGTTTTTTTTGAAIYYVRSDKTKFPAAVTVAPVILDGKLIGTIEVFRDITREKEVDRAKTEFVSLASHQLRTPLTAISWYTEMILNGDVGEVIPSQKKYLEEIYQGNHRMVKLVNTLLDVSRLELGTFQSKPQPTDMIAIAQAVLDEEKLKIKDKGIVIKEHFDKDMPKYITDPNNIYMVFQNLLSNAVDYTPPGGTIDFTISYEDKKIILIKVSDTGYGIPKNQQSQIFTKLFRADNIRNKDTDGTGLGLYITKSIVENSGGKIWFESPSPSNVTGDEKNPGTTFYVTLPLEEVKNKEEKK